jgi:hypothetical protein
VIGPSVGCSRSVKKPVALRCGSSNNSSSVRTGMAGMSALSKAAGVKEAQGTKPRMIDTPFGSYPGATVERVVAVAAENRRLQFRC